MIVAEHNLNTALGITNNSKAQKAKNKKNTKIKSKVRKLMRRLLSSRLSGSTVNVPNFIKNEKMPQNTLEQYAFVCSLKTR